MLYDTDNGEDDNDNGEYGKNNGEDDNDDGKDDNLDGDLDDDAPPVLEPFFLGGCGKVAAGRRLDANSFHFIHNLT